MAYFYNTVNIQQVDQLFDENGSKHRTLNYNSMKNRTRLVCRRGNPVTLVCAFDRVVLPTSNRLDIVVTSSYYADTEYVGFEKWPCVVEKYECNRATIKFTPPSDSKVGYWKINIGEANSTGSFCITILLLFNAWCPEDEVYMENEEEREEYVLNENGYIGRAYVNNEVKGSYWSLSQFEPEIEICVAHLVKLRAQAFPTAYRNNAVHFARHISAVVNSEEDNGLVLGNWENDYRGGTSPLEWKTSKQIFAQYLSNGFQPVKYGQCWVFAAVQTTIHRFYGIPSRIITNFNSAVDADRSLTVDTFIHWDGSPYRGKEHPIYPECKMDDKGVWGYHVWNEIYTLRNDLPPNNLYHGWQAVDGTAQVQSEGIHQCGPAPVAAIKKGDINVNYDVAFVFAEVNADILTWRLIPKSEYTNDYKLELINVNPTTTGTIIVTKTIGSFTFQDITNTYKDPEFSVEEWETRKKALRQSDNILSKHYLQANFSTNKEDLKFRFELAGNGMIGESFSLSVHIENINSVKGHMAEMTVTICPISFNGIPSLPIKELKKLLMIPPEGNECVTIDVLLEDYASALNKSCNTFNAYCFVKDMNGDPLFYDCKTIVSSLPQVDIVLPNEPVIAGQLSQGRAIFRNPLPHPLPYGIFSILIITEQLHVQEYKVEQVTPAEEVTCCFNMILQYPGRYLIVAEFSSPELGFTEGISYVDVVDVMPNYNIYY